MEPQVDHIWPIIPAVSIRPYKGRFFDCPSSCAKGHCVALGCTRACPRAMDINPGYNHLISNKREWNNCFIKNAQKILRILPDCICKNNRFSTCTVYTIFGEHGNGSCTMMAKQIRALESHYPIIQFLWKNIYIYIHIPHVRGRRRKTRVYMTRLALWARLSNHP